MHHHTIRQQRSWLCELNRLTYATLAEVERELWRYARKDDDPDGDWDDHEHTPGDEPWHWKFGAHKSQKKWDNRMKKGDWTPNQITKTIAEGQEFS